MKKKSFAILLAAALLLYLLPGMALEAKAETVRNICFFCKKQADLEITGFERYNDDQHYVIYKCPLCGKSKHAIFLGNPIIYHSGGTETPTCTTGKTCAQCGAQYGKLGHDWGAWQSRGNNSAHFRTCQRDGCDAVDTASCSGDSSATCITLGTCSTCGGQYYSAHTFPANQGWDSDAENHWVSCTVCHEAKTKMGAHWFVQGAVSVCLKSAATCVAPAVYYTNCDYCYHKGTDTYVDPNNGPDPNNHDLVHHDAKAPTCTEIGWDAYETCSRCDYTTYAEQPALNHDYQAVTVEPTCETDGYTVFTCSRCKDSYTADPTDKLGHQFGAWSPNGTGSQSADCLRQGCAHTGSTDCRKFTFRTAEGEALTFCPVCGQAENAAQLEKIDAATAWTISGSLSAEDVTARTNGEYLSVAFETAGSLTQPTGLVRLALPAGLLEGKKLVRIAPDGTQTEMPFETKRGKIILTLDFVNSELPVMLFRLVPQTAAL